MYSYAKSRVGAWANGARTSQSGSMTILNIITVSEHVESGIRCASNKCNVSLVLCVSERCLRLGCPTRQGDVKLLDLGLSKVVSKSEMDNAKYNMTGETGSTRYMAPEVCRVSVQKCERFPLAERQ